jgi:hypothetical protein
VYAAPGVQQAGSAAGAGVSGMVSGCKYGGYAKALLLARRSMVHESRHFAWHVALRRVPGSGVPPYTAAQLAGSVLGVLAARGLWGPVTARPPASYAVLEPAPLWSAAPLFIAELKGMGVIVFLVGHFLSVPRACAVRALAVGGLIGLGVAALGAQTGGSLNPARQFAPAVVSGHTAELWVFLVAPMVGGRVGARFLHAIQKRHRVLTYRLCGTRPDGRPLGDLGREPGPVVNPAA